MKISFVVQELVTLKIGNLRIGKNFMTHMKIVVCKNRSSSELQIYSGTFHVNVFFKFYISQLRLKNFEPPKTYHFGGGLSFFDRFVRGYFNMIIFFCSMGPVPPDSALRLWKVFQTDFYKKM